MKRLILLSMLVASVAPARAELVTGVDEQARLPYWEWRNDVLSVRFVQRLPDQTRAYFAGRGFNAQDVKYIADYCIFQTVFKNVALASSQHRLDYDLSKWVVEFNGQASSLKTREAWQETWQERDAKPAQRIAFEWSLLPTRQSYQPADYNWGMTVFPVPHGGMFDLNLTWVVDGKPGQATIKNMQCAKDEYIAPRTE